MRSTGSPWRLRCDVNSFNGAPSFFPDRNRLNLLPDPWWKEGLAENAVRQDRLRLPWGAQGSASMRTPT
jgi:hypothetical protein